MADEITSGYTKEKCRNQGGVKSFIPIDCTNLKHITVDANNIVTDITTRRACYRFETDVNSSSYTEVPTGDRANGTFTVLQTFLAILKDQRPETKVQINKMMKGYYLIVAELRNGKNVLLGRENQLTLTTADGSSGQAGNDLNGFTLNFEGDENELSPDIEDANLIVRLLSDSPHS